MCFNQTNVSLATS